MAHPNKNFGQAVSTAAQALQQGIVPLPKEFGPADLQLPSNPLPTGTGISQLIIIFGIVGAAVGMMYIFFNMFKI